MHSRDEENLKPLYIFLIFVERLETHISVVGYLAEILITVLLDP